MNTKKQFKILRGNCIPKEFSIGDFIELDIDKSFSKLKVKVTKELLKNNPLIFCEKHSLFTTKDNMEIYDDTELVYSVPKSDSINLPIIKLVIYNEDLCVSDSSFSSIEKISDKLDIFKSLRFAKEALEILKVVVKQDIRYYEQLTGSKDPLTLLKAIASELNGSWKPKYGELKYFLNRDSYLDKVKICEHAVVMYPLIYFKHAFMAKAAIEIMGKTLLKEALSPLN